MKSNFKLASAFVEMYCEKAGLPPLPDGYRISPGLLTWPAFFLTDERYSPPAEHCGHPQDGGCPPSENVRGGENRAPGQDPL
nr:hypothetical protein [Candidatus Sigynarchaeum springense]